MCRLQSLLSHLPIARRHHNGTPRRRQPPAKLEGTNGEYRSTEGRMIWRSGFRNNVFQLGKLALSNTLPDILDSPQFYSSAASAWKCEAFDRQQVLRTQSFSVPRPKS